MNSWAVPDIRIRPDFDEKPDLGEIWIKKNFISNRGECLTIVSRFQCTIVIIHIVIICQL